jgi:nitrite reductase/ring-hydroxylating ferredoxin subunit/DMSO/TMAO reductase YedYZ heme-binding membrane subunit
LSAGYGPVSWSRSKLVYDGVLVLAVALFLVGYEKMAARAGLATTPIDEGSLVIRVFGACAFVLITCALAIGPLARLDQRFLPLLYNRRHLGVVTFAVAAAHAWATLDWYFAFSPLDPWRAMLASDTGFGVPHALPYIPFGIVGLLVLGLLAATSHDFWLKFLGPGFWKTLHVAIYAAYTCILIHLAFGALQSAQGLALPLLVMASAIGLVGLHLAAGLKDWRGRKVSGRQADAESWILVGAVSDIADGRALIVQPEEGEAIAVFNDGGTFSAVRNRCAHQNGPLGEGRVINGCIVCPWHGYEYRLSDGCSPPPFTEKVETYSLRLSDGLLQVKTIPNPLGHPATPVSIDKGTP